MNNYPVWWDTTVTIYNRYQDPQTDLITWYRTTVPQCFWKNVGNKVVINGETLETNNIICRIRKNPKFLEKHEWISKPNDEMEDYFTLAQGDIIIRGEVEDVINEYQSGHRSTDLLEKYKELQGCMQVDEVGINVGVGRGQEHYHVRGL